jgi:hypothetical protein
VATRVRRDLDPYKLFAKSLQKESPVNVVAVIKMMDPHGRAQSGTMTCDQRGRQRIKITSPIESAGLEVLLLGDTTEVYQPDAHRLHVTPSPGGEALGYKKRLKLLKQNYDIKLAEGFYKAGRKAVRLTATSKHPGLGSVELYVDPETQFVLMASHTGVGEAPHTLYMAINVSYPDDLPEDTFNLRTERDTLVVQDPVPVRVNGATEAKGLLGIAPVLPSHLPLGFTVTRMYYSQTQVSVGRSDDNQVPFRALAMEISDGAVSATIHEIRKDQLSPKILAALRSHCSPLLEVNGLVIIAKGEFGISAQKELLEGLRKAAEGGHHHTSLYKVPNSSAWLGRPQEPTMALAAL